MKKLRNRINVKLANNEEDYLKRTSKPSCMSHKILNHDLATIRKSKLALKLNKLAYIRMCILELSKVLMYEFNYDYIKNKYGNNSELSFTDTDSLMYAIKLKVLMRILPAIKKCFLVIGKMKDETAGVTIK